MLVAGMLVIGLWIQSVVEEAILTRTSGVNALYVDSFIAPIVQTYATTGRLSTTEMDRLAGLLGDTPLGEEIVEFKVWDRSGRILFSPNPDLIGRAFDLEDGLLRAFDGEVVSKVSDLEEEENEYERMRWDRLIETYAPVRSQGTDQIVAVSEFYQTPDALEAEIRRAQWGGWLLVGAATTIMYLVLAGMVKRASNTIESQRSALEGSVEEMRAALEENRRLHSRIRGAASRTTALNEQFLRRVSADIHDGPAQDVALALMRMGHIAEMVNEDTNGLMAEVETLRGALDNALMDMRAIAQGLRSPIMGDIGPCEAARRAAADFERIHGKFVLVECDGNDEGAALPVSITVYRVVQESLNNSFKHAGDAQRRVRIEASAGMVSLWVQDDGSGFDPTEDQDESHLGMLGMRERVELIGGSFEVTAAPGQGTAVLVRIPRQVVHSNV